jgi:hypothetical protein
MVRPVFGFFSELRCLSAQPVGSAHAVQLADTHREVKALSHEALDLAAGGGRVVLAVIQQKGENFPAKLRGVPMSPLSQCLLAFALDTLEQPIHSGAMRRDRTEPSCLCGGHSLLHVPDNLPPDCLTSLALVWCHDKWHRHYLHPVHHLLSSRKG